MCTPALRALHKRWPSARVTIAGKPACCELLRGLPYIHRIEEVPARAPLPSLHEAAHALAPHARDLAVVFPHSARAAFLAWLTGSTKRIGYARGGRSMLLTDRVKPHRVNGHIEPIYMTQEYLELVKALGCEDDGEGLELWADPQEVEGMRTRLQGHGPVVGIAPGAAFGVSKLWPAERFAAVADMLADKAGAQCVLLTGPGEERTRNAVRAAAKRPLLQLDGGMPTIDSMKATVAALDLLICNDSGARHVAVAFKVPTVCIMGPTSPKYSCGPYERGEVLREDVDCGPCQKPVCTTDHRCMTRIEPERVVEAALKHLPKQGN
jgi:heptosyltransferase-2